jgi:N-acetylglucosamine kinase-like BadF-type ATPase
LIEAVIPSVIAYAFCMRLVLGIDGGGTKTDCVLMDESGAILARARSGPSNPMRIALSIAIESLSHATEEALRVGHTRREQVARIVAGLAGTSDRNVSEEMQSQLQSLFPRAIVTVCTDMDLTLASAGDGAVVAIISGTGSAVAGRDAEGNIERAGGHGVLDGDPGSATAIGRQAIKRALRVRDRLGRDSELGRRILASLHLPSWEAVRPRMRDSADDVLAHVFPVVVDAANEGDLQAREILSIEAEFLYESAVSVIDRLKLRAEKFKIVKSGGAIGRSEFFDGPLDRKLRNLAPKSIIEVAELALAETAARLALVAPHNVDIPES